MRNFFVSFLIILFGGCSPSPEMNVIYSVNSMIGTDADGQIIPAAAVPFGMVQLAPDTRLYSSGYHYSDTTIIGFSHIHKSGGGCGDMLDILFKPTVGTMQYNLDRKNYQERGYESPFNHRNETAVPGKYSVKLDDSGMWVDLTATKRCGFHRYAFPKTDSANVIVDLLHGNAGGCSIYADENRDTVTHAALRAVNNRKIEGFRISTGWAKEQQVYFVAEFSRPFEEKQVFDDLIPVQTDSVHSRKIRAVFRFKSDGQEPLLVKVGISPVSIDGAGKNLEAEIPHWNFDRTVAETQQTWAKELNKFSIQTTDKDQRTLFYTSLYNALMYPSLYSDIDGKFRGPDLQVHQADSFNYMAQVLGLWDTFRAQCPLVSLVNPNVGNDLIQTFLAHYKHGGLLPIWVLSGNETLCMLGNHSIPVITDYFRKGIRNYDVETLFEAMKISLNCDTFGYWLKMPVGTCNYKRYGYIPYDTEYRSVSTTLEYAYDDWCMAQMARMLNKKDDYHFYIQRANAYKRLFDAKTGFMRAKNLDEQWREPFEPLLPEHHRGDYVEGNAWQWTFFVPHDPVGLIELYGGCENFTRKLDQLFTIVDSDRKRATSQADMSGLIGQYAHGNEPSHHIPYLYDYAGQAWKTQEKVHQILTTMYRNDPDGLPGNDDTGQLSAWYVFNSMGFYPVRHGTGEYMTGTPQMKKIQFTHTLSGTPKTLIVEAPGISKENFYIQSVTLNGKPYSKSYFNHEDIFSDNCRIVFKMGNTPNKQWGIVK
jgi:predicted alpha-1,2-mannosidase